MKEKFKIVGVKKRIPGECFYGVFLNECITGI